jgi:hypothetical protein
MRRAILIAAVIVSLVAGSANACEWWTCAPGDEGHVARVSRGARSRGARRVVIELRDRLLDRPSVTFPPPLEPSGLNERVLQALSCLRETTYVATPAVAHDVGEYLRWLKPALSS